MKITAVAPEALWTHCMIHREVLTFELLNHPLNEVFQAVVKFIQTNPLKPTMF